MCVYIYTWSYLSSTEVERSIFNFITFRPVGLLQIHNDDTSKSNSTLVPKKLH